VQLRKSKRASCKRRASLVINLHRNPERVPCLLLDSSPDGFRVGGISRVRQGQFVELILDENSSNFARCRVVWVGKPASKHAGEVGLQSA
jgi:hypothetical protein